MGVYKNLKNTTWKYEVETYNYKEEHLICQKNCSSKYYGMHMTILILRLICTTICPVSPVLLSSNSKLTRRMFKPDFGYLCLLPIPGRHQFWIVFNISAGDRQRRFSVSLARHICAMYSESNGIPKTVTAPHKKQNDKNFAPCRWITWILCGTQVSTSGSMTICGTAYR